MKLKKYLVDNCSFDIRYNIKQQRKLLEDTIVTNQNIEEFINKWKKRFKLYGVTEFDLSKHFLSERLRHKRNKPPISVEEIDFILEGFLRKMGSQFRRDVENVKNHTSKKRGKNKKDIKENELEFAISSRSTKINFVFVLKQDFHKKGTAIILPITILRKKNFRVTKGEEVIVERRVLSWN